MGTRTVLIGPLLVLGACGGGAAVQPSTGGSQGSAERSEAAE